MSHYLKQLPRRNATAIVSTVAVCLFFYFLLGAAPANATLSIVECRFTNPIAYDLRSLLSTRAYFKVNQAGAWARLDILSANGVVRTLYDGPVNRANTYIWTPRWNGLDARGQRLPSASYDWRLTVTRGGQSAVQRGKITISKIHFSVTGQGPIDARVFRRYMVEGNANFYLSATTKEPEGDSIWFYVYDDYDYYHIESYEYFFYPDRPLNVTVYAHNEIGVPYRDWMNIEFPLMYDSRYHMTVIQ